MYIGLLGFSLVFLKLGDKQILIIYTLQKWEL